MNNFSIIIEELKLTEGSYIDAILKFCKDNQFEEFEDIIQELEPILLNKVKAEFIEKNFIPSLKAGNSLKDLF